MDQTTQGSDFFFLYSESDTKTLKGFKWKLLRAGLGLKSK